MPTPSTNRPSAIGSRVPPCPTLRRERRLNTWPAFLRSPSMQPRALATTSKLVHSPAAGSGRTGSDTSASGLGAANEASHASA
eukprot:scaffold82230_cov37-Tisochrysis_lutea.AAC.2